MLSILLAKTPINGVICEGKFFIKDASQLYFLINVLFYTIIIGCNIHSKAVIYNIENKPIINSGILLSTNFNYNF